MSAEASKCGRCGSAPEWRVGAGLCPNCLAQVSILASTREAAPPGASFPSSALPCEFGDYLLLRELGRGGMGVVYEAHHSGFNRRVALKTLHASRLESHEDLARFRTETEAIAALDHPHILPVYEIGEIDGHPFFTMRLAERGSLAELLDPNRKPLSKTTAERLPDLTARDWIAQLEQIARAVHYAHQRGLQHRDLKPQNILFDAEGSAYVGDFGLARFSQRSDRLTRSAAILGSPAYMSPEQASGGADQVTTSADIYGLGAILYELLAGAPPFAADNVPALLRKIVEEEPGRPSLRPSGGFKGLVAVSPDRDLETICLKCLNKDPARRYGSAAELADELARWSKGEPVLARSATAPERLLRWCRRRPALAGLTAVVLCLLTAVAVISTLSASRLAHARKETLDANHRLSGANSELTRANDRLGSLVGELRMSRVEQLFASGDPAMALAWLGRTLRDQPDDRVAAEYLLNAALRLNLARPVLAPRQHIREVECVQFSPDGQWLATGSQDGTAKLWSLSSDQPPIIMAHGGPFSVLSGANAVLELQFTPDGQFLVTFFDDGLARVWSARDGRLIAGPLSPGGELPPTGKTLNRGAHRIAIDPQGKRLALGSDVATNVSLYSLPEGSLIRVFPLHRSGAQAVLLSPDGSSLLAASRTGKIFAWNAATGEVVGSPFRHPDGIFSMTLHPGGRLLATGCRDGAVRLWDWRESRLVQTFMHETNQGVTELSFHPAGDRLLSASDDRTAAVWDVGSGIRLLTLRHQDDLLGGRYAPDGARIITCSSDNTARIWDASTGELLAQPLRHAQRVRSAAFSPDGARAATASFDTTAQVWQIGDTRLAPLQSPTVSEGEMTCGEFSPSERFYVAGTRSGMARVWDADQARSHHGEMAHPAAVRAALFSRSGDQVFTACDDGRVRRWDWQAGRLLGTFQLGGPVTALALSRDARHFAAGSRQGAVRVWDLDRGERVWSQEAGVHLEALSFSPDGRLLLVGFGDQSGRLWEWAKNKEAAFRLQHGSGNLLHADFSPDGSLVATAAADDTARIWRVADGRQIAPALKHKRSVNHVAFSPDGTRLATASWDGTACVWDVRSGLLLAPPMTHSGRLTGVMWSADGRRVATGAKDGTARVWDAATGLPLTEPLRHSRPLSAVRLTRDGTRLLTLCADGFARVWDTPRIEGSAPEWLPSLAEVSAGQRLTERQELELVGWNERREFVRRIQSLPDTNAVTRWTRWLLRFDLP
ncbi:MAG: protein kinase [Verrucomicrobia bacterium]|nr:protein kinase [Verrucomicrobiota bacterium]MBI3868461.1 protein kinase [Verrucomicrobiota bacterium]